MQSLSQHRSRRGEAREGDGRTMLLGQSGVRAWTSQRLTRPSLVGPSFASLLPVREHVPGAAARRGVRRALTHLPPQSLDVVVEKRWARR